MIFFHNVRWQNLLSTGNVWTEIQLDRTSTTLIIGENGAGKSTILDALCFGLFGKPFRKINKPQLVNTVNQKGAEVEIEFSIGKNRYKIHRGIKPNTFEIFINDKMVDQTASARDYQEYLEKSILGLNFNSFTQIVILGSSTFVPFMQLPAQQRRDIIEDLLDIRIFSMMNILLKEKLQHNKEEMTEVKFDIDLEEERYTVHEQYINEIKNANKTRIDKIKNEIIKSESAIARLELDIKANRDKMKKLADSVSDLDVVQKKVNQLYRYESKMEDKVNTLKKEIKFYEENDVCPTCEQDLAEDVKDQHITKSGGKMTELGAALAQLASELEAKQERLAEISIIQKEINDILTHITDDNNQISSINRYIGKISSDLETEHTEVGDLKEENAKLKDIKKQIIKFERTREKLTNEKQVLDIAADMLKDKGIKTQIVKQYIPVMNKLVNKYLAAMEFFVNFEIDENFNEVIKSRHRDDFSYSSFSEGEKTRIDLALLLTWRAIAKMKNSTNTNLLILDEVFDGSLDGSGMDYLHSLFEELKGTNLFIISHRGDQLQDKFKSIIRFEKRKNFSFIV